MRKIQVLGAGCHKCKELAERAEAAAKGLGIEFEIEKVTDINEIISFGVMATPALVIDGDVKTCARIPSADEIREMLK
jgi:small redox-active disulfide protein 2